MRILCAGEKDKAKTSLGIKAAVRLNPDRELRANINLKEESREPLCLGRNPQVVLNLCVRVMRVSTIPRLKAAKDPAAIKEV